MQRVVYPLFVFPALVVSGLMCIEANAACTIQVGPDEDGVPTPTGVMQDFHNGCSTTPVAPTAAIVANALGDTYSYWGSHSHIVYYNTVTNPTPRQGKLLVFLAARGGDPSEYTDFMKRAVIAGYSHVISLAYFNDGQNASGWKCGYWSNTNPGSPNPYPFTPYASGTPTSTPAAPYGSRDDCFFQLTRFVTYGAAVSSNYTSAAFPLLATLGAKDSVVNRLMQLLTYLNMKFVEQHWDTFYNTDVQGAPTTPKYYNIAFAGVSLGGAVSATLGKTKSLYRVLTFAGLQDNISDVAACGDPTPSSNMSGPIPNPPNGTPATAWMSLIHNTDASYLCNGVNANSLGIPNYNGSPLEIDDASGWLSGWPWTGVNQFLGTETLPAGCGSGHSWVIQPCGTAPSIERLHYKHVWDAMLIR